MTNTSNYNPLADEQIAAIANPVAGPTVEAKVVRYVKPENIERSRHLSILVRTDTMFGMVQVLREGGENKLHSHPNMDGLWFVLKGRVRFYTTGDELVCDIGPNEAVLTPRNFPYWFEKAGDEDLELLQFEAFSNVGDPIKRQLHADSEVSPDLMEAVII